MAQSLNSLDTHHLRKKRDEIEEEKKREEEEKDKSRKRGIEANGGNGVNGGNGNSGSNGCSYKAFLSCNLQDYDGKGGAARGREVAMGMTWVQFKVLLVEEFYPSNEMKKLQSEFWNHTIVGANHAGILIGSMS
ncbi:hypothetical protein Tco_1112387 [Tanacetum coccineum]|uniref:Uncharacterized protein n=1 Tax=Tanacetum coccineum TaxID=301880 RepID=A0ABQ5IPJ9_9ASTR